MDTIMQILNIPLSALLSFCDSLLHNHILAIVLFTFLTKVILIPLSIWMQHSSITMVRIMPELNRLKVKFFGDKDTIAEETQKLYKREGYHPLVSILPMIIQLVLLMGVIGAVENLLEGTESMLSMYPSHLGGITLLMPVAAGLAALALGVAQNLINPLQREQSKAEQWMTNGISILISLVLGAFVPVGVGFYWIASNLFSILNQALMNVIVRPAKHIDYEALAESKKQLEAINALAPKVFKEDKQREKQDYKRFFSVANKHLVFYSEGQGFYKYYEGIVEYLLGHSNVVIHYITSDPKDSIFQKEHPRFKPYYIGAQKLITLMMKMDADIVVMTMPDLQNFHIKRSYVRNDIEYVYIPHGMDSLNLTMRTGSVDHYDTVFCVGAHQKEEIEQTEVIYGLPKKKLVDWGYTLLDTMRAQYSEMRLVEGRRPSILIAPSWQDGNIVDSCLEEMLEGLRGHGYQVTVRPHPQHVRHRYEQMETLKQRYAGSDEIQIQTDFSSNSTVFEADLLITDWSGIAYEFAYTTCKPVLFVDTPMKIMNLEYEKIGVEPINIFLREEIGARVAPNEMNRISDEVAQLLEKREEYREKIEAFVHRYVYHVGESAAVGAKYFLNELKTRATKK